MTIAHYSFSLFAIAVIAMYMTLPNATLLIQSVI